MKQTDRAWAEISLHHLAHNYHTIRNMLAADCKMLASVKANAYGHGCVRVAQALELLGVDYLATACLDEALTLRQGGITIPILIFGHTPAEYATVLIEQNITQAVFSPEYATELSAALSGCEQKLTVHMELETGLGRLGFSAINNDLTDAEKALSLPHLNFEGIYTHFSVADTDADYTNLQATRFTHAVAHLEKVSGQEFQIKHLSGSAGMLRNESLHANMVRPGLALYGLSPNPDALAADLIPVMSLKARIMQVRECMEDSFVSYGNTYQAKKGDKLAVLHLGYADGIPRNLSGNMEILIHGQKVPQVGRICMDMIIIDVTHVPAAKTGDIVTIFGEDGSEHICISELATKTGTIPYEILCGIAARVPRVYTKER